MIRVWFLVLLAWALAAASPASAHTRSQSRSNWVVAGDTIEARVEADAVDVTRLYALGGADEPMDALFATEVGHAFQVTAADTACPANGAPVATLTPEGRIVARLGFTCATGALERGPIAIESALFLAVAPSHLHFLSLRGADGETAEAVLTQPNPRAELDLRHAPALQSFWHVLGQFVPIGAEHVWTGLDHMAFILALVLLSAGRVRSLILAATGFTIGHTITLGLAAIGALRPEGLSIEALIGFTIAFVALGIGEGGAQRFRDWSMPAALVLAVGGVASLFSIAPMSPFVWFGLAAFVYAYPRGFPHQAAWLALIFGLIHGCGFAGALASLDLPKPRLIASLLGFNLGVEFGQVVVIAAALALGALAKRAPGIIAERGPEWAGAGLFALGCFWFVSRLAAAALGA